MFYLSCDLYVTSDETLNLSVIKRKDKTMYSSSRRQSINLANASNEKSLSV